jgi:hypothetical protein
MHLSVGPPPPIRIGTATVTGTIAAAAYLAVVHIVAVDEEANERRKLRTL